MNSDLVKRLALMGAKTSDDWMHIPRASTGTIYGDFATDGGWPRGAISILWGQPQSGKSTMFYLAAAALHEADPTAYVAYIDTERAVDARRLKRLGIDMDRFVVINEGVSTIEAALNMLKRVALGESIDKRKGSKPPMFSLVGIDSLVAVTSSSLVQGEIGDFNVGRDAKLITDAMKMIVAPLAACKVQSPGSDNVSPAPAVLIMNQSRENFNYGNDSMPGGRALQHAAAMIVKMKPVRPSKDLVRNSASGGVVATTLRGEVTKNKLGEGYKEFELTVRQDENYYGVDTVIELTDLAIISKTVTNKNGDKWAGGSMFFEGVEIDLSAYEPPPEETQKGKYKLRMKLYEDDPLFERVREQVHLRAFGMEPEKDSDETGDEEVYNDSDLQDYEDKA
jgi:recombination protein RecA